MPIEHYREEHELDAETLAQPGESKTRSARPQVGGNSASSATTDPAQD